MMKPKSMVQLQKGYVMSEITMKHANQNHLLDRPLSDLHAACSRLARWAARFDSNSLNWAEANGMSEGDVAAIHEEELRTLDEIEALLMMVTEVHAVDQVGIEWKQRALDALTLNHGWDPDSLYALQRSIARDNLEVTTGVCSTAAKPTPSDRGVTRLNLVIAQDEAAA